MENKDLGSKKINNEQIVNEGFSGKNIPESYNPSEKKLNTEVEKDAQGKTKVAERARNSNTNGEDETHPDSKKNIENKDFNFDVTPKRYPDLDPANQENRGNIKMDGE